MTSTANGARCSTNTTRRASPSGEAWVVPEHQHLYASEEELGQVFNFEFAKADWFAEDFRIAIREGLESAEESGSTIPPG